MQASCDSISATTVSEICPMPTLANKISSEPTQSFGKTPNTASALIRISSRLAHPPAAAGGARGGGGGGGGGGPKPPPPPPPPPPGPPPAQGPRRAGPLRPQAFPCLPS